MNSRDLILVILELASSAALCFTARHDWGFHSSGQCPLWAYVVCDTPEIAPEFGRSGRGRGSARSDRDRGSLGGPVPPVTHSERKVIIILTNPALIDWISPDRRRVEILQDDISTVSTNKIVATSAGHSFFCVENGTI